MATSSKRSSVKGGGGDSTKKSSTSHRYMARVVKGDNAWKREWGGFISGIKLTEQGTAVKLPRRMDLEKEVADKQQRMRDEEDDMGCSPSSKRDVDDDGQPEDDNPTFGYLFASSSMRRQERQKKQEAVEAEQKAKKRERLLKKLKAAQERGEKVDVDWDDPLGEMSQHQKAMLEAQRRGLHLEGMSRKEIRQFLHLTVTKEQQKAAEQQREVKPYELMDPKLAWYQQGPFPLDVISEKLVIKKAAKHAKQQGLRYNFLSVHPSWVASRARKRIQSKVMTLGTRLTFDDEGAVVEQDKWRSMQLTYLKEKMLASQQNLTAAADLEPFGDESTQQASTASTSNEAVEQPQADHTAVNESTPTAKATKHRKNLLSKKAVDKSSKKKRVQTATPSEPQQTRPMFLVPPSEAVAAASVCDSESARDRPSDFRKQLQTANLTTNFMSSSLIQGPNIGIEDLKAISGANAASGSAPKRTEVKRATPRPTTSSFATHTLEDSDAAFDSAWD